MSERFEGTACPCCAKHIIADPYGDDGAFCWECGLYAGDDPARCDNEEHAR